MEYRDANDLNGSIKTISGVCNTEDCQNNINTYKLLQNKVCSEMKIFRFRIGDGNF